MIFSQLIFKVIINYLKLNLSKMPLAKDADNILIYRLQIYSAFSLNANIILFFYKI